ncbi:unnamed protein product [Rhizopus stolonifer]
MVNLFLMLNAPGVYVFTELYNAPNVVQASELPEVSGYYKLLSIFMYGTWKDYQQQKTQLPTLTDSQTKKLLHLTIVTLSEISQTIDYDILSRELDIPTVRELEDIIMDAIYKGILQGKLDQHRRQLQVVKAIGRDLGPEQIQETMRALEVWSTQTFGILGMLDAKIDHLKESVQSNEEQKADYSRRLEELRKNIRESSQKTMPSGILQMEEHRRMPSRYSRGPKRLMVEKS